MASRAFLVGRRGPENSSLGPRLRYPESDVARLATVFREAIVGFDEVQDYSSDGSVAGAIEAFDAMASRCDRGDTLLFYFSGHGQSIRGELYLLWDGTDERRWVSSSLPVSQIRLILKNCAQAGTRLLVLDCCQAGAAATDVWTARGPADHAVLDDVAHDTASAIIAACGKSGITHELPRERSGFLTHLLVRALSSDFRQADIDKDGRLSVTDFIEWCARETARLNGERRPSQGNRVRRPKLLLEAPRCFGEFSRSVFLTPPRVMLSDTFERALEEKVRSAVQRTREFYRLNPDRMMPSKPNRFKQLRRLAQPLKDAAGSLTDLRIIDELFDAGDDAAIFGAAVMLEVRRDPRFMERLIALMGKPGLRRSARWRVARAISRSLPGYELSPQGRVDLIARLRRAVWDDDRDPEHAFRRTSENWQIDKIRRRLRASYAEVFPPRYADWLQSRITGRY